MLCAALSETSEKSPLIGRLSAVQAKGMGLTKVATKDPLYLFYDRYCLSFQGATWLNTYW